MVSFLIVYASWSGNTQEVAEIIEETTYEIKYNSHNLPNR